METKEINTISEIIGPIRINSISNTIMKSALAHPFSISVEFYNSYKHLDDGNASFIITTDSYDNLLKDSVINAIYETDTLNKEAGIGLSEESENVLTKLAYIYDKGIVIKDVLFKNDFEKNEDLFVYKAITNYGYNISVADRLILRNWLKDHLTLNVLNELFNVTRDWDFEKGSPIEKDMESFNKFVDLDIEKEAAAIPTL